MTISALPAAPSRSDAPDVFVGKANAFVAALQQLITEINATVGGFNVTKWISGTTYAIGDLTWSPIDYQTYRRKTAGAGTTDPSADSTNWALHLISGSAIQAQTYTAFTTAGSSGTFTLTATPAIASYIAGQRFRVKFHAVGNGTDTLNISSLGAKSLKQYSPGNGSKVAPRIVANMLTDVEYDGTDMVILEPLPSGTLISETYYGINAATPVTFTGSNIYYNGSNAFNSFAESMPFVLATTGTLPAPLVAGATYYVQKWTPANGYFHASSTPGGPAVALTSAGSGTHSISNPVYNKAVNNPSVIEIELLGPGGGGGGVTAVAGAAAGGGGSGAWVKARVPASSVMSGDITLVTPEGGDGGSVAGTDGSAGSSTSAVFFTGSVSIYGAPGNGGKGSTSASSSKLGGHQVSYTSPDNIPGAIFIQVAGNPGGNSVSTAAVATSAAGMGAASPYGNAAKAPVGVTGNGLMANVNSTGSGGLDGAWGSGGSGALGASAGSGGRGMGGLIIIREYS